MDVRRDFEKYINVRIAQLKQDMEKAHDDYDKQWYNRIIQELCWVKSQQHNCYYVKMEGLSSLDAKAQRK